ncbi:metallopeptidase family protein [Gordonibacter massiliensis (ex Traore et al. 2017)]|uniref:Metallopeptidase family protein n=1 Tax=Gordonibacter massiliensis (ex Traore et al. 2017) TaxID=1841863 RepID=A0A842JLG0_9ACTN|nr:metallopeptidase family protein [Gordonibacter massiliensis (ex Traore et al. 2017)]MBC2890545.1 metallopeptidase family protein [Gordonibacter massiliensis (ex Traore et al. 2017)]
MGAMGDKEFEDAVEEALERIPARFLEALENVAVVVDDEPNEYHWDALEAPDSLGAATCGDELLGLYDGVNLLERADGYDGDLPDVITVFKGPHERCFGSREEIVEEIGKTVVHEIGHYFGLDDDRLYELGY